MSKTYEALKRAEALRAQEATRTNGGAGTPVPRSCRSAARTIYYELRRRLIGAAVGDTVRPSWWSARFTARALRALLACSGVRWPIVAHSHAAGRPQSPNAVARPHDEGQGQRRHHQRGGRRPSHSKKLPSNAIRVRQRVVLRATDTSTHRHHRQRENARDVERSRQSRRRRVHRLSRRSRCIRTRVRWPRSSTGSSWSSRLTLRR